MEKNNELKKADIENRTCYYFDDIMKVVDIYFDNILLEKKSYEIILVYDISYKTVMGARPLRIMFDSVDGFNKIYNGIRYLVLFGHEKYNAIYDRINYLLNEKVNIKYSIIHNFAKVRIDSYNSLPIKKH